MKDFNWTTFTKQIAIKSNLAAMSFFLLNLKSVYEGGIDLRNKDSNFKGMLNN